MMNTKRKVLIGVVLLLVLAAQAGILRPEMRVGAGAALAAGLVAVGARTNRRPGGRVGHRRAVGGWQVAEVAHHRGLEGEVDVGG